MRLKSLIYLVAGILLTATLIPTFLSATELDSSAQISPRPTNTYTPAPIPPTSTPTPIPPTPTNTPIPPTPTFTPIPPTPTNTPIPPTATPTPLPPTPTPMPPALSLGPITIDQPEGPVAVDLSIAFTVSFTEPLPPPFFATWYWGDGSTTDCTPGSVNCPVNSGGGSQGTLSASHTYSQPGIYAVQFRLVDSYGQSDTSTYEFLVIYDPSAGFVSGGGWIDSPAGAYYPDPSLAGKATFGFVSEYKRGSNRPDGNTQFRFKAADLKFFSDTYDWLVVNQNGSNAQFKGSGTINGAGAPTLEDYRFIIWAGDGDASDTADTFRIKIWYDDTHPTTGEEIEMVVYDNGDDQAIGGGNVTVHKPSNKK